jgi:hypothetical protein
MKTDGKKVVNQNKTSGKERKEGPEG